MYKAELEMEKRLNDIALANVPATSYENIVIVPRYKHHTPLEMKPDEFDLRDLMLEQKINVISSNAIVNKLGWKPSKIKSDVTKEMIADFQIEQMKNIKNGLYIPPALDLDLLELPEEVVRLNERELQARQTELQRLSEEIAAVQEDLKAINQQKFERQERVSSDLGRALVGIDDPATGLNALRRAKEKRSVRAQADNAFAEIERLFTRDELRLRERFAELSARYTAVEADVKANAQAVSDYEREYSAVQAENARRRRIYEDEVRSVNQGMNFVSMLPEETTDEYKQRLRDIGDSTGNLDAIQAAATLRATDQLREKMAEITRDEVLVNTFILGLNGDQRYSLVKIFDTFKKKVMEVFGFNNKFMSVDDLTDIGNEMVDIVAVRATAEPAFFKSVDERDAKPLRAFVVEEGSELEPLEGSRALEEAKEEPTETPKPTTRPLKPFTLSANAEKLSKARKEALVKYATEGGEEPKIKGRLTDKNETIYQVELVRANAYKEERERREATMTRESADVSREPPTEGIPGFADLQLGIQTVAGELADEDQKERLLALLKITDRNQLIRVLRTAGRLDEVIAKRGTTGRGLHPKYPKFYPFGVIEISPHKLFYENILKVTRKGKHLTGFPNVKVSDAFVKFMFKIIEGGQPTLKEVNRLSVGEKQLFDSVVFTAGLSREVETTGSGVKQDLKNRLALIEGEVEAGNTNPELVKEARKILQHLARMKIIGHRAAATHLKQLINAQRE